MAELGWGAATHEGQIRAQNEDSHLVHPSLFVVADGMGGHQAGEVASAMTIAELARRQPDSGLMHLDDLVEAINVANEKIFTAAVHTPAHAGMGTTVSAVAVVDDPHAGEVFGIANVGDSRVYVLRHRKLRQITIDHSYVQELVAEGAITRDEARTHPRRNIVTRALGIESYTRVDSWTMPIIRGDRFVICSDGLSDEITEGEITEILEAFPDSEVAAQELVNAANEAGGRDNITAVVIDVFEGEEPPDPTEEIDVVTLWEDDDEPTGETQIITDPLPDDDTDDTGDADDAQPHETSAAETVPPDVDQTMVPTRRIGVWGGLLAFGAITAIVVGAVLFAAWARTGYFVAFNDNDEVKVYKGRDGGVLWFDPTVDADTQFTRENLTADSAEQVEQRPTFQTKDSASAFVTSQLEAKPGTILTPPASSEEVDPEPEHTPDTTRSESTTTSPSSTIAPTTTVAATTTTSASTTSTED